MSMGGNHDNPVSGNHQVLHHTEVSVEKIKYRSTAWLFHSCMRRTTQEKWLTSKRGAVNLLRPWENAHPTSDNLMKRPLASIVWSLTLPKLHFAPYKIQLGLQ